MCFYDLQIEKRTDFIFKVFLSHKVELRMICCDKLQTEKHQGFCKFSVSSI